jgi:hypothetical protein
MEAEEPLDFGHVWHNTLTALDAGGLAPSQRAFLRQAKFVGLLEETALLAVPDEFTKEILETKVRQQVVLALSSQLGKEIRLAVTVDPALRAEGQPEPEAPDLASLTELEADESPDLSSPFSTFRTATNEPGSLCTACSRSPLPGNRQVRRMVLWMWLACDAYLLVRRSPASDAGATDETGRSKAALWCMRKLGPRYRGHDQQVFACKVIELILADAESEYIAPARR